MYLELAFAMVVDTFDLLILVCSHINKVSKASLFVWWFGSAFLTLNETRKKVNESKILTLSLDADFFFKKFYMWCHSFWLYLWVFRVGFVPQELPKKLSEQEETDKLLNQVKDEVKIDRREAGDTGDVMTTDGRCLKLLLR